MTAVEHESPVLSVADAAAYIGVSRATLYRICAEQGQGRSRLAVVHTSARRRGFLRVDLDKYLARQRQARST